MPLLTIVHTNLSLITPLADLAIEILPGVQVTHIVDDSLLRDVRRAGVTQSLVRRMCSYFDQASTAGADLILSACSSVGETVDVARQIVPTPILKIDEPMADDAVAHDGIVAVLATVESTLHPTCRLLERKAREAGRRIEVRRFLSDGALDLLVAGDTERHDELIAELAEEAAREADVILLAQGSMARMASALEQRLEKRVLASPRSAMQEAARRLGVGTAASC